jgi:hypothetical protein
MKQYVELASADSAVLQLRQSPSASNRDLACSYGVAFVFAVE